MPESHSPTPIPPRSPVIPHQPSTVFIPRPDPPKQKYDLDDYDRPPKSANKSPTKDAPVGQFQELSPHWYRPYQEDTQLQQLLGKVGRAFGEAAVEGSKYGELPGIGPLASKAAGMIGEQTGVGIGFVIENHQAILDNVQTFANEVTDWKSYTGFLDPSDPLFPSNRNW